MKLKISLLVSTLLMATTMLFYACRKDIQGSKLDVLTNTNSVNGTTGKISKMSTLNTACFSSTQQSITLSICTPSGTGKTGAPAGFTIQWMTKADYDANGQTWPSDRCLYFTSFFL